MTIASSCELNSAGLTWEATAYLFHIAFALLLLHTIYTSFKSIGALKSLAFGAVAIAEIVFQAGFTGVLKKAQACVGDEVWRDGSSVWLFNLPFAFIWLGAASWGLLAFSAPGSWDVISLPQELGTNKLIRLFCALPGIGSLYAVIFLVGGGTLMKPEGSSLYWFEPILAATLTLSGFTWLAIALGGADFIKMKSWSKIPLSRPVAFFIGLSAAYYCVWRLNGGLVLSSQQWSSTHSTIRKSFEANNLNGEEHKSWQHLPLLRKAAAAVGVPFLIEA